MVDAGSCMKHKNILKHIINEMKQLFFSIILTLYALIIGYYFGFVPNDVNFWITYVSIVIIPALLDKLAGNYKN